MRSAATPRNGSGWATPTPEIGRTRQNESGWLNTTPGLPAAIVSESSYGSQPLELTETGRFPPMEKDAFQAKSGLYLNGLLLVRSL